MSTSEPTWMVFTVEELAALTEVMDAATMWLNVRDGACPDVDKVQAVIDKYMSPDTKDQKYRDAAENQHMVRDGECEIDAYAVVSRSDDLGAYVMAWVWVPDEDAGYCRNEECREDSTGGDGFDGLCGNCADKEDGDAD